MKNIHPQELTPTDQEKAAEKDDDADEKEKVSRQLTIGEKVAPKSTTSVITPKKVVGLALAEMITQQAVYPFRMVEHPSFRLCVRKIVSVCGGDVHLVQFPSRNTVRRKARNLMKADRRFELQTFMEKLSLKPWRAFAIGMA